MNRWKAGGIHFLISLAVFFCLLGIILLVWYPGLLFDLNGGWEGLRIVIGVDLVLGPMLTLIVYQVGKPSLKFDLTCIAVFQSVCLLGGVWVVYQERPIVLAFEYDSIFSLSAREYKAYGNDLAALESFEGGYPKKVYIDLPSNDIEAVNYSVERQLNNEPLYGAAENYQPLPENNTALVRDSESLRSSASSELGREFPEDCLLARFVSSSKQGFVCVDPISRSVTSFY